MPLLSWIRLIDVHQNAVFEKGKNRRRARVTGNRCKLGRRNLGRQGDGATQPDTLSNTTRAFGIFIGKL